MEGVRAKAANCLRCGYRLDGLVIRSGAIVCPECGHASRFAMKPGRSWLRAIVGSVMISVVVVIGIVVVFVWPQWVYAVMAAAVVIAFACAAAGWVLARVRGGSSKG
ncbi:MAG: hypothetical protein IPM33_04600 [Phycisphaerales bacterium]|nr:hypothetical protein [Phycisphaerales bacterium]